MLCADDLMTRSVLSPDDRSTQPQAFGRGMPAERPNTFHMPHQSRVSENERTQAACAARHPTSPSAGAPSAPY